MLAQSHPVPPIFWDQSAPDFRPPSPFLDDKTYGAAIGALINVTADVVLYNSDRRTIFLATRCVYPAKSLWILGGRMKRGEQAEVALQRKLKAEAGFTVDTRRLRFLSMNRFVWAIREQDPQELGCDDFSHCFAFEPTPDELAAIQAGLTPDEYDTDAGLREFTRDELVAEGIYPQILKLYGEIFGEE